MPSSALTFPCPPDSLVEVEVKGRRPRGGQEGREAGGEEEEEEGEEGEEEDRILPEGHFWKLYVLKCSIY